jgi:hypothetical protein
VPATASLTSFRESDLVTGSSIHAYLRAAGEASRTTVRTGPFLALLHPTSSNPFLNYAIPDDAAEPTAAEATAHDNH